MKLPKNQPARIREVTSATPITKADLALLRQPRRAVQVQKIKESHHHLARLFAGGLRIKDVAARTGYSYSRVQSIATSPAFRQLVEEYRGMVTQSWLESLDDYTELSVGNMVRAELLLSDRLAEAETGETVISVRDLVGLSGDKADRFGYGKHQTQTNVNVDFASRLENAIRRSGKGPKIIESTPVERARDEGPAAPRGEGVTSAGALPLTFKRRA